MSDVRKIATTMLIGDEVFETNPFKFRVEALIAHMWQEIEREKELTRLHGPLHRPGRNELWLIEAPIRRRQRTRDNVYALMPGKRPGFFIRTKEPAMEQTVKPADDPNAVALQARRDAYVQAKVDAYVYENGKKPAKALIEEWTEKANTVVV